MIEAIESEMIDWFALGTQFHPECARNQRARHSHLRVHGSHQPWRSRSTGRVIESIPKAEPSQTQSAFPNPKTPQKAASPINRLAVFLDPV
ncbi:MAG: hypothetical protein U0892_01385 [Pirellulales bacterium]